MVEKKDKEKAVQSVTLQEITTDAWTLLKKRKNLTLGKQKEWRQSLPVSNREFNRRPIDSIRMRSNSIFN